MTQNYDHDENPMTVARAAFHIISQYQALSKSVTKFKFTAKGGGIIWRCVKHSEHALTIQPDGTPSEAFKATRDPITKVIKCEI